LASLTVAGPYDRRWHCSQDGRLPRSSPDRRARRHRLCPAVKRPRPPSRTRSAPVGHSPGRDQPPRSKVPTTEERAAPEGVVGDLPGPGPPERLLPGSVRPRPRGRRAQHRARPGHRQYLGRESQAAPTATAMLFTFSTVALAWASLAILRTPSQAAPPPSCYSERPPWSWPHPPRWPTFLWASSSSLRPPCLP
jgi:hypothetical protein